MTSRFSEKAQAIARDTGSSLAIGAVDRIERALVEAFNAGVEAASDYMASGEARELGTSTLEHQNAIDALKLPEHRE
jgi:hypothetical protein